MSEKELISKYLTYGDKPSYFVNNMPVNPEIADLLLPGDVISRDLKTNTPNPNGEIWLILTEKAMLRLKLPTGDMYDPEYNLRNTNSPEKDQNKEKSSQPVIKNNSQEILPQQKIDTIHVQLPGERKTVVRSRSVNNVPVKVKND
jgi:hypothetical protein